MNPLFDEALSFVSDTVRRFTPERASSRWLSAFPTISRG